MLLFRCIRFHKQQHYVGIRNVDKWSVKILNIFQKKTFYRLEIFLLYQVAGWENGELNSWSAGQRTFVSISATHKSPIVYIGFSEQGGRMVSADSVKLFHRQIQIEN